MKPSVLVLHAPGTNRDHDVALACDKAGGKSEIVHVERVVGGEVKLKDHQMLVFPGGFSYGDDLGSGTVWASTMKAKLSAELKAFVDSGKPVLGICNGFQTLVKLGVLPGKTFLDAEKKRSVTLTENESARFECRWVTLNPNDGSECVFTKNLKEPIFCPVAHGEGRIKTTDAKTLSKLKESGLIALRYDVGDGDSYPANPNGSDDHIAGLTNDKGNVLGLMPHPENHIDYRQHPSWHRGERGRSGLPLFEQGIRYAADCQ